MNYHSLIPQWKRLLSEALNEDQVQWDWTSTALKPANKKAEVIAKSPGVWVGQGLCEAVNLLAKERGVRLQLKSLFDDGVEIKKGTVVCEWVGDSRAIVTYERAFLNLLSYVSGIATQTRKLVKRVSRAKTGSPRVTATRKTLPGYKDLAIYGVLCGGGYSHRLNLGSGVLVKENHIAAAGSVEKAVSAARSIAPHGLRIEVEVRNLQELQEAIEAQVEVVLLDNFSPAQVKRAVAWIQKFAGQSRPLIEVSGGVNEKTIQAYAQKGVDVISVGGLTHSVMAMDYSLLVRE